MVVAIIILTIIFGIVLSSLNRKKRQEEEKKKKEEEKKLIQKLIEEKKAMLIQKYGEEIGLKLLYNEYWIGMTEEQIIDAKGKPTKIDTEVLKTKTKKTLVYGNKSSGDYFVLENGVVVKFMDR
jgi:type II secretory pathway pseudopilin PulG